jgi:hypothetical protein
MVESGKKKILESDLVGQSTWDRGIDDLRKSGEPPDGTFFYTWFKGVGVNE